MKYIYLLLCLFLVNTGFSQSKLEGVVFDGDGVPIVGATLLMTGTNQGTVSDIDGKFSLSFSRTTPFSIRVSAIGYVSEAVKIDPKNLSSLETIITLQEDEYKLQAVEIMGRREDSYKNDVSFSGSKVAAPIKDIPQSISFVTKELMVDQQAFTTGEVVKNMSGINQFSSYDDFTLRGFRSRNQLINGLRAGGIFWALPITANLERIEVIKGPASALFANTDPGGTINRVTKKPLDESRKSLQFSTGSFNTYRVALDFTGPMNEEKTLLYRLNVAYQDTESFRTLQGRTDMMVAPSFTFLPSDKTAINFDLVYSATRGKLDRGQPIFGASAGTDLFSTPISLAIAYVDDYLNIDNLFSTISLQHKFNANTSLNVSYIKYLAQEDLQEHRTSNQFARDGNGNEIPTLMGMSTIRRFQRNYTDNISAYLVHEFTTGSLKHKLLGGYDYIQRVLPVGGASQNARGYLRADGSGFINTFNPNNRDAYQFDQNDNPLPNVPHFNLANPSFTISNYENYLFVNNPLTAAKYTVNGFYIQDQIEYNRLTLLLSLRQEFYTDLVNFGTNDEEEVTQSALIPRMGAVYALNQNINAYATYSQGYQPQGAGFIGSPEVFGGPFDPLTSRMAETGFKGEFFNRRLFATTAIYQITQNNILINANNPENPDQLAQRGQERARGIEFDVAGNITKNLSLTANYAYNRTIITESDNEVEIGHIKENAPLHQGGFWSKYVLTEGNLNGLGFALGGNFVSSRNTFSPILSLPSYFVADAALYYTVDKFRVSVNFRNLANQVHWVGGYDFNRLFPGEPRNFLATVAYNF